MNAAALSAHSSEDVPQTYIQDDWESDVEVNLAPAELLIVDDDDAALERLGIIAEGAGYSVTTAHNGLEALKILNERPVTLVLADVIMPEMSGTALCEAIRSTPFPSYVYTIVLSARDGAEDVVAALDAGADDFISKRASRSELLARLRTGRRIAGLDQALRRTIAENIKLCHVDALTGCFNRRYLTPALDQEIERSRQHGHWVSVLMCDVDRFKKINDRYGHAVGDEALQQVIIRLRSSVQEKAAWVARYGGDEFVIVLPETPIERACIEADIIKRSFDAQPLACSVGDIPLTLSIGVSGVGPVELRASVAASRLLDAADECMYASKSAGRNMVTAHAYSPNDAVVTHLSRHRGGG